MGALPVLDPDRLDAALDLAGVLCANAPLAVQASKRVAVGAGGIVIAGIDRGGAVAVDAEHHRMRMPRPVPHDPDLGGQPVHQQVAPGVMRVLDDDFRRAGRQRRPAGDRGRIAVIWRASRRPPGCAPRAAPESGRRR